MAPNRKNIKSTSTLVANDDLTTLQSSIQPKFLPLTDPNEGKRVETNIAQQQQQQQQQQKQPLQEESAQPSYWDWQSDDQQQLQQESDRDVTDMSNIESNLIQDSVRRRHRHGNEQKPTAMRNDEYWTSDPISENNDSSSPDQVALGSDYWSWPSEQDTKKAIIGNILAEEAAYQMTSASSIEAIETNQVMSSQIEPDQSSSSQQQQIESCKASNDSYWQLNSPMVGGHVTDASHPSNKYWTWDESNSSKNKTVEYHVKSILEYEAARVLLSADNIVKQLQSSNTHESSTRSIDESIQEDKSDEYWTHYEEYGDKYWDVVPTSANMSALAVGKSYWD